MVGLFLFKKMKKVSIQGVRGAFHEEAAKAFFQEPFEVVPQMTFEALIKDVESGGSDYGLVAIENTISGTINENFELIAKHGVHICGEQKLRINQNLGALPGTRIEDLREVRSHYMAIHQCREFLSSYPQIKLVEEEDTALSAKRIAEEQLVNVAAIGSKEAMDHYGLEVLQAGIETIHLNYTRFYVISAEPTPPQPEATKLTIKLMLDHQVGCLATLLFDLQKLNASLSKIESAPIIGTPWKYQFFIELEIPSVHHENVVNELLKKDTTEFKVLGHYQPSKIESYATL